MLEIMQKLHHVMEVETVATNQRFFLRFVILVIELIYIVKCLKSNINILF